MTIIKTFEIEEQKPVNSKIKKILIGLGAVFISVVLIKIWVSNTLLIYGEKFASISQMEQQLKMENLLLKNEIARLSSLHLIASRSAELGFSNVSNVQYIR